MKCFSRNGFLEIPYDYLEPYAPKRTYVGNKEFVFNVSVWIPTGLGVEFMGIYDLYRRQYEIEHEENYMYIVEGAVDWMVDIFSPKCENIAVVNAFVGDTYISNLDIGRGEIIFENNRFDLDAVAGLRIEFDRFMKLADM